jgi:hypothetical protein
VKNVLKVLDAVSNADVETDVIAVVEVDMTAGAIVTDAKVFSGTLRPTMELFRCLYYPSL